MGSAGGYNPDKNHVFLRAQAARNMEEESRPALRIDMGFLTARNHILTPVDVPVKETCPLGLQATLPVAFIVYFGLGVLSE